MKQNYINHIAFVIDASSSMDLLSKDLINVFDTQISELAESSKKLDQETRVSVYLFADTVKCLVYDMDVMRFPSIKSEYKANGMTALLDGTGQAIKDLQKTPELYGDHSFLIYVLTDGIENASRKFSRAELSDLINSVPSHWTLAVMVPNIQSVSSAIALGFPKDNIIQWKVDKIGFSKVSDTMRQTTASFMQNRAKGVRGTKNLFSLNTNISSSLVKSNLEVLPDSDYETLLVRKYDDGKAIKDFIEGWTAKPYRLGSAYYQLSKPEKIQANKNLIIRDKKSAKAYTGDNARSLLGLPDCEVKVSPAEIKDYDIFVQSNSINRKLVKDTMLLLMK